MSRRPRPIARWLKRGLQPGTPEWDAGIRELVERQSKAMAQRLYPAIPGAKYVCFYPMDRKRGEKRQLVHRTDGRSPEA